MLHAKKFAIVSAYDIYLECCEGKIDPQWVIKKPVGFHRFREKLAIQMLNYIPAQLKYNGDSKCRAATQLPKKRRRNQTTSTSTSSVSTELVQQESERICGDLAQLHGHIASVWSLGKSGRLCAFCGKKCHQQCGRCDVPLHYHSTPDGMDVPCFFIYHDIGSCGLAKGDCKAVGTPKKSWKLSSRTEINSNRKALKTMLSSNNNPSTPADSNDGNNDNEDKWNDQCI